MLGTLGDLAVAGLGPNERVHGLMQVAIWLLCGQVAAEATVLERRYDASPRLVVLPGVLAFILAQVQGR